jgi:peptidyl-prolyl cis-trans isomerase A (cyclophilin A)
MDDPLAVAPGTLGRSPAQNRWCRRTAGGMLGLREAGSSDPVVRAGGDSVEDTMKRGVQLLAAMAAVGLGVSVAAGQAPDRARLRNPSALAEKAPDTFKAALDTSKGQIVITVHRDWAPLGADRFYNLVKSGYLTDVRFFRVLSGFMAQFGINGDPAVAAAWRGARIQDDPVKQSNKRGYVTFATAGPNTRTTQLFINYRENASLDKQGFAPIGEVTSGMDVVDQLYSGYGEGAPSGKGPSQQRAQAEGNAYLMKEFPRLDYIKAATIEP